MTNTFSFCAGMRGAWLAFFMGTCAAAFAAGQDAPVAPRLVLCGGGSLPEVIVGRFRQLAGPQPKLVVIPTATRLDIDVSELKKLWASRGFSDVHVLHTTDRAMASRPAFVAPLKTASAVWFGGGSQQRIADAYLDTPIEKELYRLVQRGGVVGGTSAGAAIQSRVMIASGRTQPTMSKGLKLLPGAIVDQHFLKRNRIPRLVEAVSNNPGLIGIGLDEGTALVVDGDKATVQGRSYVMRIESRDGGIHMDAFNSGENLPLVKMETTSVSEGP